MTPHQALPTQPTAHRTTGAAGQTAALLAALWQQNLPVIRERLAQLDRAATLAAEDRLTPPLRRDGAMTAHKLAGSLGMFGYHEGTRVARLIEQLLDLPHSPDAPTLLHLTRDLRTTLNL